MGPIVFQKDIYGGIPNSLYLEMGPLFKTTILLLVLIGMLYEQGGGLICSSRILLS